MDANADNVALPASSTSPSPHASSVEDSTMTGVTEALGKRTSEQLEVVDESTPNKRHLADKLVSAGNTGTDVPDEHNKHDDKHDDGRPDASVIVSSSQHHHTASGAPVTENTHHAEHTAVAVTENDLLNMTAQYSPPEKHEDRLAPCMQPEVYSRYRTAICETLPYFSSFQGSLYSLDKEAKGFLIDKEFETRDYLGSQVIITSCGGGRVKDSKHNVMVRNVDQNPTSTVIQILHAAKEKKFPIGVIIGEDHPMYPCKPPQAYCVMDFFIVTDIWSEKVVYRVAETKGATKNNNSSTSKKSTEAKTAPVHPTAGPAGASGDQGSNEDSRTGTLTEIDGAVPTHRYNLRSRAKRLLTEQLAASVEEDTDCLSQAGTASVFTTKGIAQPDSSISVATSLDNTVDMSGAAADSAEVKTVTVKVFKIRLEKVDKTKPSWWAPPKESDFDSKVWQYLEYNNELPRCPVKICTECGQKSKEIYTAGWTCLNFHCLSHFQFPGTDVDIAQLTLSNMFLAERNQFDVTLPPVRPPIIDPTGLHGTEKAFRKGIACPNCGLCSSRVHWNKWTCESVDKGDLRGCGMFQLATPMQPCPQEVRLNDLEKFTDLIRKRKGMNNVILEEPLATLLNIKVIQYHRSLSLGKYTVRQYFLPNQRGEIIGSVTVFSSNMEINSRIDGPDEILEEISLADIGLRRNPAAQKGHKGQGLTRHFAKNFGAPYKFGVSVESKGFDEAPDCVLKAIQRLDWAAKVAIDSTMKMLPFLPHPGQDSPPGERRAYNELLILGYMEKDQINYHDDGEKDLGPTVSTLSLGSGATMGFRPKASSKFPPSLAKKRAKGYYHDVLEFPVGHGDMVVMHGAAIHRFYEHCVVPHGERRFAMTCRYIDPSKMTDQVDIDATIVKGKIPAHASKFTYDGN